MLINISKEDKELAKAANMFRDTNRFLEEALVADILLNLDDGRLRISNIADTILLAEKEQLYFTSAYYYHFLNYAIVDHEILHQDNIVYNDGFDIKPHVQNGLIDKLEFMNFSSIRYMERSPISNAYDRMVRNNNDLWCFELSLYREEIIDFSSPNYTTSLRHGFETYNGLIKSMLRSRDDLVKLRQVTPFISIPTNFHTNSGLVPIGVYVKTGGEVEIVPLKPNDRVKVNYDD